MFSKYGQSWSNLIFGLDSSFRLSRPGLGYIKMLKVSRLLKYWESPPCLSLGWNLRYKFQAVKTSMPSIKLGIQTMVTLLMAFDDLIYLERFVLRVSHNILHIIVWIGIYQYFESPYSFEILRVLVSSQHWLRYKLQVVEISMLCIKLVIQPSHTFDGIWWSKGSVLRVSLNMLHNKVLIGVYQHIKKV